MRQGQGGLHDPTAERVPYRAGAHADKQEFTSTEPGDDGPFEDLVVQVQRSDAEIAEHPGAGHDEHVRTLQDPDRPSPFDQLARYADGKSPDQSLHRVVMTAP